MTITSKWFHWLNLQEQKTEFVQAWQRLYLELLLPSDLLKNWQELEVFLQQKHLPLMLRKSKQNTFLIAEWPAMNAGFCSLSLYFRGKQIAKEMVFVQTEHLEAEQWVQLLQDLRFRLPVRNLLKVKQSGSMLKLNTLALPGDPLEDAIRLIHAIETPQKWDNIVYALQTLNFRPHREAQSDTHWQKIQAAKKPNLKHLAQKWNQRSAMILDHKVNLSIDIPVNQFIAAVSIQIQKYLRHLIHYLQQTKEFELAEQLHLSLKKLEFVWQSHPFRTINPQLKMPEHTELLFQPEYKIFVRLWHTLGNALLSHLNGAFEWAYRDLSELYQHWCLLQLADQLLEWAHEQQWEVLDYHEKLQRGQSILVLRKNKQTLHLENETSYLQQGEFISLTHTQRPDISLRLQDPEQSGKLILFESKFRSIEQAAYKEDIDKLHTYRDAIRYSDGRLAIQKAILLYPGKTKTATSSLELWQMKPGHQNARHLERILKDWF